MPEPTYPIESCRSDDCRKAIIWGRTKTGKMMPVDAVPTDDGTVRLYRLQGVVRAQVLNTSQLEDARANDQAGYGPLRTAHFTTCPAAASWRK